MPDNKKIISNIEYKKWITDIKTRLRTAQSKAAVSVNTELLKFYWELGADIVEKQKTAKWGTGFLQQLSNDLNAEFPELKGFSYRNIRAIRQWYLFYNKEDRKMAAICSQINADTLMA